MSREMIDVMKKLKDIGYYDEPKKEKVDETIKVNFKSNLFNVLNSTDKLLKTPTHFTVFKEKIPTQYPNWFSFINLL